MVRKDDEVTLKKRGEERRGEARRGEERRGGADDGRSNQGRYCTGKVNEAEAKAGLKVWPRKRVAFEQRKGGQATADGGGAFQRHLRREDQRIPSRGARSGMH
jgi:hypothetical protein